MKEVTRRRNAGGTETRMAKKGGPSIQKMHIAFGIGSLLLLITTGYAFVQDHFGRDFPQYQKKYDKTENTRLSAELERAKVQLEDYKDEKQAAVATLEAAENEKKKNAAAVAALEKEVQLIDNTLEPAAIDLNFLKADLDELKFKSDSTEGEVKVKWLKKFNDQQESIRNQFNKVEALKAERDIKVKQLDALDKPVKDAKKDLLRIASIQDDLDIKIKKLQGNAIINLIRDAPALDFVDPKLRIEQVVLPNLPVDMNFNKTQRVDRCVSCHKAIDNPDPMYTERDPLKLDPVLRSHPRLDLMVGSESKHSYKQFGCTVCHQGSGFRTEFSRVAHTPQNAEQAKHWAEKYHWKEEHYWDAKMLPLQHTEASCLKCHKGVDDVPQAHKLNEGRQLFRDRGCANCHIGATDKDMAWVGRVGPDLRRIGEKTDIEWARSWIYNPWDFRPSTKMPRFFGLENRADLKIEADGKHMPRDPVEAEAIAQFLFTASKLRETKPAEAPKGDAEEGRDLFTVVGCVGCHSTLEKSGKEKLQINDHGPDLSRIAEKVTPAWLHTWLKNPRHYWAETKMPDLRLNDKEAADITAYLMGSMKGKEARKPQEKHTEAAFEFIIRDKLSTTTRKERIDELMAKPMETLQTELRRKVKYVTQPDGKRTPTGDGEWNEEQVSEITRVLGNNARDIKAFHAGAILIQHHGCYSCHNIQGWTYEPLTCPNLGGVADKDLDKFDFGKALLDGSVPNTKWDWFATKISRPRVFDRDKESLIKPFDRLRMPWFGFTKGDPKTHMLKAAPKTTEHHAEGAAAAPHAEGAAHAHGRYHPASNPDLATGSPYGLSEYEVTRLVTHLLSLTNDPIPTEMKHQPTAKEISIDRGHRVIRELNCTGCHIAGLEKGLAYTSSAPNEVPMEALVVLLVKPPKDPDTKKIIPISERIYVDEDVLSIDYPAQPKEDTPSLSGVINIQRGTFLTSQTVPILLNEKRVRSHPTKDAEPARLVVEKKKKNEKWARYTDLVSENRFAEITRPFFNSEAEARATYAEMVKADRYYVEIAAFERVAGSMALFKDAKLTADELAAGKITYRSLDKRRTDRTFYSPATVKVRFTSGEGRIIPHIVAVEKELGNDNASAQQAPPSLSFEGGKVQPDWLYQFLKNVHTVRPGLKVRMPSFWSEGPSSSYKLIYPTGHQSAVYADRRPTGIKGEPTPGAEQVLPGDLGDDAAQLVDFFIKDSETRPYGYQSTPLNADSAKTYALGMKVVTGVGDPNYRGCMECHGVGQREPSEPKWAPNLAHVKRRIKGDWLRRFLTNPASIYPWTNMPNNFDFGWDGYNFDINDPHRGMLDSNAAKFNERVTQLKAAQFFLLNAGENEVGKDLPAGTAAPAAAPAAEPEPKK